MAFKVGGRLNYRLVTAVEDQPNRLAIVLRNDPSQLLAISGFNVGINIVAAGAIDKALLDASFRFFCARGIDAAQGGEASLFGAPVIQDIQFEYHETLKGRLTSFTRYFIPSLKLIEPVAYSFGLEFIFGPGITGFIGTVLDLVIYGDLLPKGPVKLPYELRQ